MKKIKTMFWTIVGIQFLILFAINGMREYRLHAGTTFAGNVVLLKTRPIDPRDLFRGDYVNLRYEITTLDNALRRDSHRFERGDAVYVRLMKKDRKYWEPIAVYSYLPDDGNVYLRGECVNGLEEVRYGIESYFVPEGKGWNIERQRSENVFIEVAIDTLGNGTIKQLFIGDNPVKF